jgi:Secretion system C-terminal sorting domain
MRRAFVMLACSVGLSLSVDAQLKEQIRSMMSMVPKSDIICYSKQEDQHTIVPPPLAYQQWKQNKNLKTRSSDFEVTYIGFPADGAAQTAFQKAVDIWSTLIESEVPIRITASWQTIKDKDGSSSNILGSANPGTYFRDFDGAQRAFTWYPVALAEKMAGKELNATTTPDILAQFNSAYPNWYFGIDGIPKTGKTDFVTVVLHEIGHGLGITKSYDVVEANGVISSPFSPSHVIYDHFIENSSEKNLVRNFIPPSTSLKTELTRGVLYFRTVQLDKPTGGTDKRAILYAPNPFEAGSSIAHLDEIAYDNTPNALMTPRIGTAEVAHDPGPVIMKMLADMGWVNTQILHTQLSDTEAVAGSYPVKVMLEPDKNNGYSTNTVKLHYTTDASIFTEVVMIATANVNEFSASIPAKGFASTYGYYVSVKDNLGRSIVKPGISAEDGKSPFNLFYVFEAGPDTKAPFINHTAKPFILATDGEFKIEAIISDNISVLSASLEYQINGADQTPVTLTLKPDTDSTYTVTVPLPGIQNGDKLKYRIRAKDNSLAQNETASPSASEFYELNVVTLAATQDFYSNNFNSVTEDFFGDNIFNITTPSGFSNGAIHTTHPYPNGTGSEFISNFIYQLKVPIRLNAVDATLKFDEIVLVEPGDDGSVFGDNNFFDYVIVEGSKDGGVIWEPLADGYDSRDNTAWLTKFASSNDSEDPPNSNAAGDPSLYKQRIINMTSNGKFIPDDIIVIRFRLNTDQLVHGWGWTIDNLKIQIDDAPPVMLHDHYNFFNLEAPTLSITTNVSDNSGVSKLLIDYKINNGSAVSEELPVSEITDQYTLNLTINGLANGDLVEYRIRSQDNTGNEGTLPAAGYFSAPVLTIGAPVTQYITDFNSVNSDFAGNFFSVSQPSGFSNGAIHSTHPYPNGFGLTNKKSDFVYILKKPITISDSNPNMVFDEIGLVEYTGNTVKDFIVIEGSKDNGATWEALLNPYSASANSDWKNAFDDGLTAGPALYRSRLVNLTSSGKFVAGDVILIRFRLTADGSGNGWGWSIDNLSIQGPVTEIEKNRETILNMYPNPVTNGKFVVELAHDESGIAAGIQVINAQGQIMISDQAELFQGRNKKEYSISSWADGIYFLRVTLSDGSILTQKFIKADR